MDATTMVAQGLYVCVSTFHANTGMSECGFCVMKVVNTIAGLYIASTVSTSTTGAGERDITMFHSSQLTTNNR
jgi:hypothetical protein